MAVLDMWVYDNPDTMCRELFKHGHLVIHFPEEAFDSNGRWYPRGENWPVQEMYWRDMMRLGKLNPGAEYGDRIHKPFDPLATELWSNS